MFTTLLLATTLQATWFVDSNATAPGTGTANDPYSRIDFALAQSTTVTGDTISVSPGTYLDEAIDYLGKDVEVRSVGGAAATQLNASANGPVVRLDRGESLAATLEGFTLVGRSGEANAGGACIYCDGAALTIKNCELTGNSLVQRGGGAYAHDANLVFEDVAFIEFGVTASIGHGGGIWAENSTLRLTDCRFSRCESSSSGAAIDVALSRVVVRRTLFENGRSDFGGAMYLGLCETDIEDCEFLNNSTWYANPGGAIFASYGSITILETTFDQNFSGGEGGAIHARNTAVTAHDSAFHNNSAGFLNEPFNGGAIYTYGSLGLDNCTFEGNWGNYGGALYCAALSTIRNCHFRANESAPVVLGGTAGPTHGGAICCNQFTTIENCSFVENAATSTHFGADGGAIFGSPTIRRCTFVRNSSATSSAGAVHGNVMANLVDCILRDNGPVQVSNASVSYSNIEGGWSGLGNIDSDPQFRSTENLALFPDSPCIDAGDPAGTFDADGTRGDMGAYAFDALTCGAGCGASLGTNTCVANVNSTGQSATLTAFGDSLASADVLILNVVDGPSLSPGYFLTSRSSGSTLLGGGSQGLLCLGGNVLRFSRDVLTDRGTGVVAYRPRVGSFPSGSTVLAGESWFFQYWFRDANPGTTSNTSSALRVDFQ